MVLVLTADGARVTGSTPESMTSRFAFSSSSMVAVIAA
jgi:hypothetical protein